MRTTLHKSLLCTAAVVMVFPLASLAQQTGADINARTGMESHIGNVIGHAKAGQSDYRRYCAGCHGDRGDGMGRMLPGWIPSRAIFNWAFSSAAQLLPEPCRPIRTCRRRSLAV